MNRSRAFPSTHSAFKPAFEYLAGAVNKAVQQQYSAVAPPKSPRRSDSLDGLERGPDTDGPYSHSRGDNDDDDDQNAAFYASNAARYPAAAAAAAAMDASTTSRSSRSSSNELQPPAIPLIDISRSPSPYARNRVTASAAQSEDEDDYEFEPASSIRPLVAAENIGVGAGGGWKRILRNGGLGNFMFGTWLGWQVYVALLVFWVGGCGFGLLLMNRFILWTGVYKFPYPLAATYIQLVLAHIILVGFASLTRGLARPLRKLGLGAAIAPSHPVPSSVPGYRGAQGKASSPFHSLLQTLRNGSGGIAGGGLFEFDRKTARQVLPLALVYVGKVVLSNLSFAYAVLPIYQSARIGVVPISLILTSVLMRENHSIPTLSSTLIATLNLFLASIRPGVRVTWEGIVSGVFSSLFVALYPILLLRTYRSIVADLVPQGDILTGFPAAASSDDSNGTREETRAYWRTLHYTSLLSILILTPIVLLSGEVGNILRNCYFLDVPFFWFLTVCGAIGCWAVFSSTLLLAKATSPLTVTFISIPRGAFQLLMLSHFKMPVHSWVGIVLCWISSAWFLMAKREEGRMLDRLRLEGR